MARHANDSVIGSIIAAVTKHRQVHLNDGMGTGNILAADGEESSALRKR